jgi:hypothetical protein
MNRISRSITTIYRTESLIARRSLAVIQNQTILMALAGVLAMIGLVFLNLCFYFILSGLVSPTWAACILAILNLILTLVLAITAAKLNVEREIAPVVEVRDMAIADLEVEMQDFGSDVRQIVGSLKNIPADPLGSLTTLLVPILTPLLKKKK